MKESMPHPKSTQEQQERHAIPQQVVDDAFEELARLDWPELPELNDSEERLKRLSRAVTASLLGVDASEIQSNGDVFYHGTKTPYDNGAKVVHIDEFQAYADEGIISIYTSSHHVDYSNKDNPDKISHLKLKVSPDRFIEIKERADRSRREEEARQTKEYHYWMDRRQKALPAFLAFAQKHNGHKLTPEDSEPIQPFIEAIRHGRRLEPTEQLLFRQEENDTWRFHFYRNGELYDIHEYEFDNP